MAKAEMELEITTIDTQSVAGLVRAEIDMQIATAHRFPRDLKRFLTEARGLATLDEDTAMDCIYSLKREGRDGTKFIEGPSIRMAEILQHAWGNNRSGARLVDEGAEFVTAQGIFHDLERNSAVTREVQRRIVDAKGRRYGIDMIGVTGNAAASIALRNAVTTGIPRPYWQPIMFAAKTIIIGDARSLGVRREKAVEALNKMGLSPDELFAYLDVRSQHDIDGEMIVRLRGLINALREGDTTIEQIRPRKQTPDAKPKADISGSLNGGRKATAEPQDGQDAPAGQSQAEADKAPSQAAASKAAPVSGKLDLDEVQAELWSEIRTSLEGAATVQEVDVLRTQFDAAIDTQPKIAEILYALFTERAGQLEPGPKAAKKL